MAEPLISMASTTSGPPGRLERADRAIIAGWVAGHPADPPIGLAEPIPLNVFVNDTLYCQVAADRPRPDIALPGVSSAARGFRLALPLGLLPLDPATIAVRWAPDGPDLPGSPVDLPPLPPDDAGLWTAVSDAIAGAPLQLERDAASTQLAAAVASPRWLTSTQDRPMAGDPIALVIDDRTPDTARDAGSKAILSHMQSLQRVGYRVTFIPSRTLASESAAALQDQGITAWTSPWIASVEEVLRRIGPALSLVYVHRHANLARYATLIRDNAPQARIACCVADLHFLRMDRQARVEHDSSLASRITRLRGSELATLAQADVIITHSAVEASLLADMLPDPNVHLVPWHVPADPIRRPFSRRHGIAFVGSFGHAPNRDAADYLATAIMPLVFRRDPSLECLLVGSLMPGAIAELARPGIAPIGSIPDMQSLWACIRVSVAPLRFGAGLKGKVLDSLAAGIPCVATSVATEGMDLPPALAELVCDTPEEIADTLLALHWDKTLNQRIAAEGLAWIAETFSVDRIDTALAAALPAPTG